MATVYSWRSLADIPFPDTSTTTALCRSYLFLLKNLLLGQSVGGTAGATGAQPTSKWTLVGSSNGSTFGLDSTERLGGSTFDATKWVWAYSSSTTTAHSWFILYNATLGVYWLVDCKSNTTSENVITTGMCTSMPTGGSLTTAPSLAGVTIHALNTVTHFESAATGVHRANWSVDTANGFFFLAAIRSGASTPQCREAVLLMPTAGPTQRVPWLYLPPQNSASAQGALGSNVLTSASDFFRGRSYDGASGVSAGMISPGGTSLTATTILGNVNAQTGMLDTLPSLALVTTTGHRALVNLEDVELVGDSLTGTVTPASGAIERAIFGSLLLPFSAAFSL